MRKFTCRPFGEETVDLDDPKTYDHLPNTVTELRDLMFRHIGYSYWYMNFRHEDIDVWRIQKKNIAKLITDFTNNEIQNRENVLWYQEQVFLFLDETENMC